MKKFAIAFVAVMIMVFSAVSASAADVVSPTTPTVAPTTPTTTNPPATSPKTGVESSDALLFAGLAVAGCAGIAVVAKKRISE